MNKKCQNCGFENAEKDKFCRKCGNKLVGVIQPVEEKVEPIPQEPKKITFIKKESKISNKMVLGIAVVAFILSIAAISSAVLISPTSLSAAAVGTEELADNSVTGQKVVDGTITDDDIDTFGISKIKSRSITGAKILNNTIALAHLTNDLADAITCAVDIANDSITGDKIKNGTIKTNDLADNTITSAKIKDGEISSADIANNAVTSSEIASGAVDTSELSNGAVTYDKMNIKIKFGHETNVYHGKTITHDLGAIPTSIIVTPRFNSSLPTNATIIANVFDVGSNTFRVAMSVCVDGGNIAKVDGSTWGAEQVDWIVIRTM